MKEKTQYEALMEELQKIVENFRDGVIEIGERLSKVLPDIEIPDEEEDTWEMKCPYKDGDRFYIVNPKGSVKYVFWNNCDSNKKTFNQGNIFKTKQAAELEAKRRNLLTRFKAFRDECNNGWEPDWKDFEMKWDINYKQGEGLRELCSNNVHSFSTFGYFKNKKDAERAIELFGDEIKELFVDCEAQ